jgi:hypothetical protein
VFEGNQRGDTQRVIFYRMDMIKVWIGFCVAEMCRGMCDLDNVDVPQSAWA